MGQSIQEDDASTSAKQPAHSRSQFSRVDLYQYFIQEGNWRYLAGTSFAWFILDFTFFGLGFNNPRVIAEIWATQPPTANATSTVPSWVSDLSNPGASVYDVLKQNSIQSIITISIGSLVGSLILLKIINYIPRQTILAWSFLGLAVMLGVTAATVQRAVDNNLHGLVIALYVLCQLLFNLGPNTLTFIIPAEIFPTRYRCTCHGVSAAAGKLGSVLAQIFLTFVRFRGESINASTADSLAYVLAIFAVLMASGSIFVWAWIPNVQREARGQGLRLESKTLEELAVGRAGKEEELQVGLRRRVRGRWPRRRDGNV